ncbi:hypothetical protein CA54_24760 [Symmachiella macrocystis]|uniref:Antitoxin ParD4 n=1 Tax=Symmachiella macrocystis TaxID=2527985 RepID=A0A5C6BQH5_9PLAN|nr:type II toxin-antitoxin system ParD family antitoxin [Symmachiella macrocystis]TWU13641.1 hypothetical protein CA54_24760 [Symmachiella macrocystis]
MSNTIPTDLEQFVSQQFAAGQFHTPNELAEAVRAAAVELFDRDQRLKELQAEVQPALDRLEQGEGVEADFEDIKRRGSERLASRIKRD